MRVSLRTLVGVTVTALLCCTALATTAEILEDFDTNSDGKLSEEEIEHLVEELVDEEAARGECPSPADLITAADADSSGDLTGTEIDTMAAALLPCLAHFQTMETMVVRVDGKTFNCAAPGEEGDHDGHGHQRRLLAARRRLAVPDVEGGAGDWSCTEVDSSEEEEHGELTTGQVWLYSLLASLISALCSLSAIVFMLPVVGKVREYGDDIAACAMGALLAGVIFHMLPEAVIEVGGFTSGMGVAVLGGFLFAYMLEHAIHVSREAVEEVVDPACAATSDHQAHYGHHIPDVPATPVAATTDADTVLCTGDCEDVAPAAAADTQDSATAADHSTVADAATADDDATGAGDATAAEGGDNTPVDTTPASAHDDGEADGADHAAVVIDVAAAGDAAAKPAPAAPASPHSTTAGTNNLTPMPSPVRPSAESSTLVPAVHSHSHAHGHGHSHGLTGGVSSKLAHDQGVAKALLPMVYVITAGDFVHNCVDGLVIGAAFMGCDSSVGWAVMAAVILHEVPQELGDYVLLRHAGMTNWSALAVNFLTALGSLLGVVIVVGIGTDALNVVGYFLAFGSGVLLFIAAADILPPLMRERDAKRAIIRFGLMLASMGIVGLTLLHDVHCESIEGHEHAH